MFLFWMNLPTTDVDAKDELKIAPSSGLQGSILMVCHEPEFYEGWTDVWDFNELV